MFVPYMTMPQYVPYTPAYNGLFHMQYGYGHPGYVHPMAVNPLNHNPYVPYGLSHMDPYACYAPVGFNGGYSMPYMHPYFTQPQMYPNTNMQPMQPAWSNPMAGQMHTPNHG